jgi:hypothetical protein
VSWHWLKDARLGGLLSSRARLRFPCRTHPEPETNPFASIFQRTATVP